MIRLNARAQAFLLPLSSACDVCDSVLHAELDAWPNVHLHVF